MPKQTGNEHFLQFLLLHRRRLFKLLTKSGRTYSVRIGRQSVFPRLEFLYLQTPTERKIPGVQNNCLQIQNQIHKNKVKNSF